MSLNAHQKEVVYLTFSYVVVIVFLILNQLQLGWLVYALFVEWLVRLMGDLRIFYQKYGREKGDIEARSFWRMAAPVNILVLFGFFFLADLLGFHLDNVEIGLSAVLIFLTTLYRQVRINKLTIESPLHPGETLAGRLWKRYFLRIWPLIIFGLVLYIAYETNWLDYELALEILPINYVLLLIFAAGFIAEKREIERAQK